MSGCPSVDSLRSFVLRLPEPSEIDELAGHLVACAHCAAIVRELGQVPADVLLRELRADRPRTGTPVQQDDLAAEPHDDPELPGSLVKNRKAPPGELTEPRLRPAGDIAIGETVFGRYRILRELGRGGMGCVFLAEDTVRNQTVALKVPHPETGVRSREVMARFQREARAAASLTHKWICPIYDVGQEGGQCYFSMPCIRGRSLAAVLKSGTPLTQRQILIMVHRIADAMAAAHAQGVIHRDLKPANIMITKSGRPIVMDFGLARREESDDTRLTQTGAFVGTPAYVSPEQITNRSGEVDFRTDIYSLGVIAYEMICGRLPFEAEDAVGMLARVLTEPPPSPTEHRPDVNPILSDIIMRAIAFEPARRYQSMGEFQYDLRAYLRGEYVSVVGFEIESNEWADEEVDFLNIDFANYRGVAEEQLPSPVEKPFTPARSRRWPSSRSLSWTCGLLILLGVGGTWWSFPTPAGPERPALSTVHSEWKWPEPDTSANGPVKGDSK